MTRFAALVVALCLATPSLAGEERTGGPETTGPPTGRLSDPEEPPRGLLDALVSGKVHLDDRLRVEWAKTTGRSSSTAVTNRLPLGYETRAFHGFSALVETENVATPDVDAYSVPPAGSGSPDRTVIAGPPETEVNQALVGFGSPSLADSGLTPDLQAGRRRTNLDDQRFVGGLAWRQFEPATSTRPTPAARSRAPPDRASLSRSRGHTRPVVVDLQQVSPARKQGRDLGLEP